MGPELCAVLLSWAVNLSGYPRPAICPSIVVVEHAYLVQRACSGRKCDVLGWYPGHGHNIYLDARLAPNVERNLHANSILLHELVHYLQWLNGKFYDFDCEAALWAERQAYAVQRAYTVQLGTYMPTGQALPSFNCGSMAAHGR